MTSVSPHLQTPPATSPTPPETPASPSPTEIPTINPEFVPTPLPDVLPAPGPDTLPAPDTKPNPDTAQPPRAQRELIRNRAACIVSIFTFPSNTHRPERPLSRRCGS